MNLIRSEFIKVIRESLYYYPDYIVAWVTDLAVFFLLINGKDNYIFILASFILWIMTSGVLSEAAVFISSEKHLGTLQNLMTKPYDIIEICLVKGVTYLIIHLIRTFILLLILSLFIDIRDVFNLQIWLILLISWFGILGFYLLASGLTLIYTKVSSFVAIVSYGLLLTSGTLIEMPSFVKYTNPVGLGTYYLSLVLKNSFELKNFFVLFGISLIYFIFGAIIFKLIFKNRSDFKFTY